MFKKIYTFLFLFFFGIIYNFRILVELPPIITNKYILKNYLKIFILNFFLLNFIDLLYNILNNTINNLFIKYFIIIVYSLLFYIPLNIFSYIYTFDKINNILNYYSANLIKIPNSKKDTVIKSEKDNVLNYSSDNDKIDKTIYYSIIILMFYFISNLLIYIPIIGYYFNIILGIFVYSFYCFDYTCGIKNINNKLKFALFEQNFYFLLGYGTLFGTLNFYLNYICFFLIFCFLFPISVFNLANLNIYNLKSNIYHSKFFYIPISLSNLFLSIIDSYLISYYSISRKTSLTRSTLTSSTLTSSTLTSK